MSFKVLIENRPNLCPRPMQEHSLVGGADIQPFANFLRVDSFEILEDHDSGADWPGVLEWLFRFVPSSL